MWWLLFFLKLALLLVNLGWSLMVVALWALFIFGRQAPMTSSREYKDLKWFTWIAAIGWAIFFVASFI